MHLIRSGLKDQASEPCDFIFTLPSTTSVTIGFLRTNLNVFPSFWIVFWQVSFLYFFLFAQPEVEKKKQNQNQTKMN